mmetsp:Transcript_30976/g.36147  ORF Transcript_30976/g.36147 Transcript_30976/m.36147 type:complete len:597 (-) Transcript_30976:143-1933(-)
MMVKDEETHSLETANTPTRGGMTRSDMKMFKFLIIFIFISTSISFYAYLQIRDDLYLINDDTSNNITFDEKTTSDVPNDNDKTENKTSEHHENHEPMYPPLQCNAYLGPDEEAAAEMVYWMDIPSDEKFVNPFQLKNMEMEEEKYFTFEPDQAGFNNVRMALETILTLGISMGRTIVLPPERKFWLLWENKTGKQKHQFAFDDFFELDQAQTEHFHLKFISMQEYLEKVAMKGKLVDQTTRELRFPPENRTNWNGIEGQKRKALWDYLRETSYSHAWNTDNCFSYFPQNITDLSETRQNQIQTAVQQINPVPNPAIYTDHPTPVDGTMKDRLSEHLARRKEICFYGEEMEYEKTLHFKEDWQKGARFLIPYYAFHFFEDWKQALWTKRFVRDHLRYKDEMMCAAARVVKALREKARELEPEGNQDGRFNTMHIRRGDFKDQYKGSVTSAEDLIAISKSILGNHNSKILFIATDERNMTYFEPFKKEYQIYFLNDFQIFIEDVNSNFYGLVDQLIAARGDIFVGTHYSTFTAYINRLRGYYSWRDKTDGYEKGRVASYYFNPPNNKFKHDQYFAISSPFWAYEFPEAWYDLDKGIDQ